MSVRRGSWRLGSCCSGVGGGPLEWEGGGDIGDNLGWQRFESPNGLDR